MFIKSIYYYFNNGHSISEKSIKSAPKWIQEIAYQYSIDTLSIPLGSVPFNSNSNINLNNKKGELRGEREKFPLESEEKQKEALLIKYIDLQMSPIIPKIF